MLFLSHFIVGLTSCFIGALPFGAINLSVISITVRKSYSQAFNFILGASLVELLEAYIAIAFGMYISSFLNNYTFIPYFIATIFLVLGLFFFIRKPNPTLTDEGKKSKSSEFYQGLIVALLNPQAIPFWLFTLAFIAPFDLLQFSGLNLYIYLTGVFTGKLLALVGYAKLSNYLEGQLTKSCNTIDYIMGTVFLPLLLFK